MDSKAFFRKCRSDSDTARALGHVVIRHVASMPATPDHMRSRLNAVTDDAARVVGAGLFGHLATMAHPVPMPTGAALQSALTAIGLEEPPDDGVNRWVRVDAVMDRLVEAGHMQPGVAMRTFIAELRHGLTFIVERRNYRRPDRERDKAQMIFGVVLRDSADMTCDR